VRRILALAISLAVAGGSFALAAPVRGAEEPATKVAIIVGPVGDELTPVYIALAEAAARAAEDRGATVARAYSPEATAPNVLKAVEDANVVVYFGHGVGSPNPYSPFPSPETTNGWGLNGPGSRGDHSDSWRDQTLTYYGEAWIAQHARPAPGWVMIYSNACYAPGASEGFDTPADEATAATRVAAYSRGPLVDLGASAYFATDYYEGAAHLIAALLDAPDAPYGQIFASEPRYEADGLVRLPLETIDGGETWLHRSAYFEGKVDYWYAFAGNPTLSLSGAARPGADIAGSVAATPQGPPPIVVDGLITGQASNYAETAGWEGEATIALPPEAGVAVGQGRPRSVLVCAERCATLPVVDVCPCYVGTADQRVANLSHAAWALVTDAPLIEGLIDVTVHLSPVAPSRGGAPSS
jgi:hypothetical protein